MPNHTTPPASGHLKALGVYGYDALEPVVLASLVTGDPLLLIGKAGTGKTYLLNSLSEALGLEHRHYNASLIAFDDLVGFPYPDKDGADIRYLPTPATVWGAQSVLVDEISRCKPEHQNRLFSLIQERRIQGIQIESLRYRWAAMNPFSLDQGVEDSYDGSLPLDQALADRFAFVIQVPDWPELSDEDRLLIADPRGEGALSRDRSGLGPFLEQARARFDTLAAKPPPGVVAYAIAASTILTDAGVRFSPRRVRQLTRNLLGALAAGAGAPDRALFELVLRWSVPQRAWGKNPAEELLHSAHLTAWDQSYLTGREAWLNSLGLERRISRKVCKILKECPDPDTGSLAVARSLALLPKEDAGAFAFALYPAALEGRLPIGKEGVAQLGRLAAEIAHVAGTLSWRGSPAQTTSPDKERYAQIIAALPEARRERATQLFHWLLLQRIIIANPKAYEKEFHSCIQLLSSPASSPD